MAVTVDSLSPSRGRTGDVVTLAGTGFSAAAGRNSVTVDGLAAAISAESTTAITVTIPGGVASDKHVVVEATNLDTAEVGSRFWWSKLAVAALATTQLPIQLPGPFEFRFFAQEEVLEAKDFEKLYMQFRSFRDRLLPARRMLISRDGTPGLFGVGPGGDGAAYVLGGTDTGLSVQTPLTFLFGREITSTSVVNLFAGAPDTLASGGEDEFVVPRDGHMILWWVYVRSASGGDIITGSRVHRNGSLVLISGDDIADMGINAEPVGLPVSAGDRLDLRVQKSGVSAAINVLGGMILK